MHKSLVKYWLTFSVLLVLALVLTACSETTSQQKEQWSQALSQLETSKNEISAKVNSAEDYLNSLDTEVKDRMEEIDFSKFSISDEDTIAEIPKKSKEFDTLYTLLKGRIEKAKEVADTVPTVDSLKEKSELIIKQIAEEKAKAEAEEKEHLAKKAVTEKGQPSAATQNVETNTVPDTTAKTKAQSTEKKSSTNQNTATIPSTHMEYTHAALEGCVIIESDKLTGECRYQTKCPICNKVNNGSTTSYLTSGTRNGSATCGNSKCPQWGKSFDVKIKTTSKSVSD